MAIGYDNIRFSDIATELQQSSSNISLYYASIAASLWPYAASSFMGYTYYYLSLSEGWLTFDYLGSPCATNQINIYSNMDWYSTLENSEIPASFVSGDTYGSGNGTCYFYTGDFNWDYYQKYATLSFYRSSDNNLMAQCELIIYPYGQYCY